MIDTDKYEGLTIDDWYKMNHHDWKDVVNEHNDLLAEVKRLRERLEVIEDFINDELRAFVNSNTFDHIYDAIEKKLEVIE